MLKLLFSYATRIHLTHAASIETHEVKIAQFIILQKRTEKKILIFIFQILASLASKVCLISNDQIKEQLDLVRTSYVVRLYTKNMFKSNQQSFYAVSAMLDKVNARTHSLIMITLMVMYLHIYS